MSTLIRLLLTIQFFYKMLWRENFRNPFKKIVADTSKTILVLANGPSIKKFLEEACNNPSVCEGKEFIAVNAIAKDASYTILHPHHYVLSDLIYFFDTEHSGNCKSAIDAIVKKTTWSMYLYVPYRYKNAPNIKLFERNSNIIIVPFHSYFYQGLDSVRNWIFRKGLGNGEYGTVVLNAIYIALTLGFRKLELYGVDHTFFNSLCVNHDNIVCYEDSHFYDSHSELKPIEWHHDASRKYCSMTLLLEEKYKVFLGHEHMQEYATYLGADILNCTSNSMIDVYPRK